MKTLLTALQEGRLVELPEGSKEECLQFLSRIIEASPDLHAASAVEEAVLSREKTKNSGIGHGWACPIARTANEGELLCAVGWSPGGIDYGSSDRKRVHIIVVYYVPDSRRNEYLKEISGLDKAIQKFPDLQNLPALQDIAQARNKLLDLITASLESTAPDAKARMIRLEAKAISVAAELAPKPMFFVELSKIFPVTIIIIPGTRSTVLTHEPDLINQLEAHPNLGELLAKDNRLEHGNYLVLVRSSTSYLPDRVLYDCLAINTIPPAHPNGALPAVRA
ncbi:MAG: PTS sugar transporter subunit IIA [Candidatus Riflebacteria bacterium]|nr:PTS sugar transporter subunit IIA [Candidatus Riflebacteria bacterium]